MDINWQKHGAEAFSYLKGIGNKVKQVALQLTEIEVKVEDATHNEPWGPWLVSAPGVNYESPCCSQQSHQPYNPSFVQQFCSSALG